MSNPIIFTVTTAGKNAALDAQNRGLKLSLNRLTLGTTKWTATKAATDLKNKSLNFTLVTGDVEAQSSTLRFSVTMSSNTVFDAYEMGLYTDKGVLFAVATSSTQPLVRLHPDVAIVVGSFGLHLGDVDANSVTVVSDPSSPISVQMMENHLAAADPHPQYLKKNDFNTAAADIIKRLVALESKEIIPVGGLFITTKHYATGEDVTKALGYGKWERYGQGMTLVGQDPNAKVGSQKAWWATMNNIVGEFEHKITASELPSDFGVPYFPEGFYHNVRRHVNAGPANYAGGGGGVKNWRKPDDYPKSNADGGDKPHNNIQPSIVTAMWLRVPETGSIPNPKLYTGTDASTISTGGINEGIISEALSAADSLNRQLTERLAGAISRIGELEQRIQQAGGNIGGSGDAPEWQAVLLRWTSSASNVPIIHTVNHKNVTARTEPVQGETMRTTVTFENASDVSVVQVRPEPSDLARDTAAKTITWTWDRQDGIMIATNWTLIID